MCDFASALKLVLDPVVQRLDNAIHGMNRYPMVKWTDKYALFATQKEMSRTNLKQFRRLQNPVAKYSEEWNVQWYQKQHLLRSKNTRSVTSVLSILITMSFWTFNRAVSVEWYLRKPDWNLGRGSLFSQWTISCWRAAFSTTLKMNGRLLTGRKFL